MNYLVHLVPTFHYDIAYLMTFEEYFPRLKHIYTEMLNLMEKSEYSYMFEQAILVRVLNELCPEHRETLRSLVSSGRLEVTGFYVQVDNNIPCGESLIRNAILAKRIVESIGGNAKTAWMGDVFGQNAQLPQIVKICGYDYLEFSRGFGTDKVKSPFWWESLDGTRVMAIYGDYGGLRFTSDIEDNLRKMRSLLNKLVEDSAGNDLLLPSGGDYAVPSQSTPETLTRWNQDNNDIKIFFSAPTRFFEAVSEKKSDLQVVRKDMNPAILGTYGSRIRLKTLNRKVENCIITAEKLSTICSHMGLDYPTQKLEETWEKVMRNQFHDVLCGSCVDPAFNQAMQLYTEASKTAKSIVDDRLDFLARKVDTQVTGKAVLVFNPLSFDRKDIVKLNLTIVKQGVRGIRLLDETRREIPVQLADKVYYGGRAPPYLPVPVQAFIRGRNEQKDKETRYATDEVGLLDQGAEGKGLRQVTVLFHAEIPALGYRVFELQETSEEQEYHSQLMVTGNCIENRFYRVTLNDDGTIRSIVDKKKRLEFIDPDYPSANNLLLQSDRGDLYTIMPFLNSRDPPPIHLKGQMEEMTLARKVSRQEIDQALWTSTESRNMHTEVEVVEEGPVRATVKVSGTLKIGVGVNVHFTQFIHLYSDARRIDFETHLLPKGKHYRVRVCFPANVKNGTIRHEIPFGQIERSQGEYPAQNWIDYADDQKGLCIINRGIPGNNVAENTAMLTLLRSVAFEYKGASEGGYEENVPHIFNYSLIPFVKGGTEYQPWNHGNEVNNPLMARVVPRTAGRLPRRHSFIRVEPRKIALSALTRNDKHTLVRVYECNGQRTECTLQTSLPFSNAIAVDCLDRGDKENKIETRQGTVKFMVNPHEIKTIRLY
jgi:alpha-mannosidase